MSSKFSLFKRFSYMLSIVILVLVAKFTPFEVKYPAELAQGVLIATIALVAFSGVFLGQIKFASKPNIISKIPNIDRITRGLIETISLGFMTIAFIVFFFIDGSDYSLTFIVLLFLMQLGYFIGGATSSGLFRG